jgi:hypothetical protein
MNFKYIFHTIIATLLALSLGYSVQDFSVTADLTDGTQPTNTDRTLSIDITNTGDESITIDLSESDATDGSNSITLTLSESSVTLAAAATTSVDLTYNTGSTLGTFAGSITLVNSENGSQSESLDFSTEVELASVSGASLVLTGDGVSGTTIEFEEVELDRNFRPRFILVNNGNEILTDITFKLEDLEGDDDEIKENDVELEGTSVDNYELEELAINGQENLRFDFDIGNIDVDTYRGDLTIEARNASNAAVEFTYKFEIKTFSDEEDVEFTNPSPIKVTEEPGKRVDGIDLEIKNNGANDVEELILDIDEAFEQESGTATLPISAFEFELTGRFDIPDDSEEEIELTINIPSGQAQGTYSGEVRLLNRDNDEIDSVRVEVKVVGDIFIRTIKVPESINPDETLELEITLANQGNQLFRDVRIEAIIEDVDSAQSDLDQTTDTFLLDINNDVTKTLRFNIPDDAQDGQKAIEIRVTYDGNEQEIIEIESIRIDREPYFIEVKSHSVTPNVIKCDTSVFASIRVENLGKFDDEVAVVSEIIGTGIKSTSNEIDLNSNDDYSFRNVLDTTNLEAGTYEVVHTIQSKSTKSVSNTIRVQDCTTDGSTGVIVGDLGNTSTTPTTDSEDNIQVFGQDVAKQTVYLGGGLALIILLIVVSLFLL